MITGQTLRDAILSGANNIANQRTRVDELNVFPVPDGDTGTNMSMTIGAARAELEAMPDSCTVAEASKTAASAMLRGARGNSGVITSLLFRGFSKALKDKTEASSADLAAALQQGVEAAYKAVMKPTEGTILTVSRLAAEKAAECTELDVPAMWDATLQAGQAALDDTPNLLPVLKKAGVVDAGGQGIMLIFEGMKQVFDGGEIIAGAEVAAKPKVSSEAAGKGVFADDLMKVEDIKNGYCTQFLLHKDADASVTRLRAFLESNGDSVVVIEDDDVANCHVHTSDPGMMLSEAIKYGYLTNFKIENMHEQFLARQKQGKSLEKQASAEKAPAQASEFVYAAVDPSRDYGFVAVAAGEGLKAVFTDLAADAVVSGGQTMNPATEDILAAIQSVPAKTVFVLPNNKNIIMAAEQAQKLADRQVIVLPTRTVPMGITALLNFDPSANAETNTINMMAAADKVSTGLITYAARDSEFDGKRIRKGEIMALENGKIVATSTDLTKATYRLARSMCKKDSSFVTIISGCDVSDEEAEKLTEIVKAKCPNHVEVSHIRGGQPVYYYMISVE
uniref:DAK2 domain-containing protein n=1 Tax=Gemmiger formicilis TaxID=745368 RepID=UPI003FEE8720